MHVTFRRHFLDQMLQAETFSGKVLDVGGKKSNPRGQFRPTAGVEWKYLSIDPETKPDYLCSAEKIPTEDGQFDALLLCEVVEHLQNPETVLKESSRVLKPKGKLVMTIPFLYGVHADPYDFQRWTPMKIKMELEKAGFKNIQIKPMGGAIAVFCDLHEMWCFLHFDQNKKVPLFLRITRVLIMGPFLKLLKKLDLRFPFKDYITTGYYVTAERP